MKHNLHVDDMHGNGQSWEFPALTLEEAILQTHLLRKEHPQNALVAYWNGKLL